MSTQQKIAVAGATGRLGTHVVDVLKERGYPVEPMSRSLGVDLISGAGLQQALEDVECIIDAATGTSPEYEAASTFFTTATRNLQAMGQPAGVRRIVVVSIIGIDSLKGGYALAKVDHENAMLAGQIPARIVRAAQFHEFVPQLVRWATQGDVVYAAPLRTQIVSARTVAEVLVDHATGPDGSSTPQPFPEVAGPRVEYFPDLVKLYIARYGGPSQIVVADDPADPDSELSKNGGLLPGPGAILGGPTFEEWLNLRQRVAVVAQ